MPDLDLFGEAPVQRVENREALFSQELNALSGVVFDAAQDALRDGTKVKPATILECTESVSICANHRST